MTVPKRIFSLMGVMSVLLMVALFFFVFNPLGLGPEPETVLSSEFFANPAQDLNELELLVDGKAAFNEIFKAIDFAESSVSIQTYIWKDDSTGQAVAAKLKAAADRGVRVTVSKEITLFVQGAATSRFIRELREQLESDIAVSEEVLQPFELGPLEKIKAFAGKYVW